MEVLYYRAVAVQGMLKSSVARYIKAILKQNDGVSNDLANDKYSKLNVSHLAALWWFAHLKKPNPKSTKFHIPCHVWVTGGGLYSS